MSILPNSATYMASALRNGTSAREGFHKFFECWLSEQDQHLHELISASKQHPRNGNTAELTPEEQDRVVRPLIDRVLRHYEQYYRAKSNWVKRDVLTMLSPSWRSSLEDAFLWIGGWRPSMAFHLLYSKSGLQLEARLAELIRGITTGGSTFIWVLIVDIIFNHFLALVGTELTKGSDLILQKFIQKIPSTTPTSTGLQY